MKKILIASMMLALSGSVFAATTNAPLVAGSNTVDQTACPLLSATVKATLSTGNIGNVSCDSGTANIGVAVGNTTGKNKIFSIGSVGGGVLTKDLGASTAPDATNTKAEADAQSAKTS